MCLHSVVHAMLLYKAYYSEHIACPFGATASVHAWERIGNALAHLARKLLHLPVLRYVDDYMCHQNARKVSVIACAAL